VTDSAVPKNEVKVMVAKHELDLIRGRCICDAITRVHFHSTDNLTLGKVVYLPTKFALDSRGILDVYM